ncbi:hypothetical protein N0V93_006048 [Gnomoniopsis smithogilvyi]|uniref:Kynurenine formamidase n=1 Tax=Gnomoniopsis smithogilvyi TaxID=1191159 RepID=A0A9W8YR65_9PEZI|nr:hypothetical protein N0V93_006048 [Gnomoniopsis smithogilvyi]
MAAASLTRTEYYYASENALQNVAVWQFPEDQASQPAAPGQKKYWLIFIHGGAWRDPRGTFNDFEPTLNALLTPSSPGHLTHPASRIAGFASLNYRLSPHPQFAQDLAHTPSWGTRTATHPDHLRDVLAGLRFLQGRFGFGSDYVFCGHSAGAFLNYQVLLEEACLEGQHEEAGAEVKLPVAVVGFEGIYDLSGLNQRMKGTYSGFIEAAFGKDENGRWDVASPATAKGSYKAWSDGVGKLAVLVQSPDDELVDMAECDTMEARLRKDGVEKLKVYRDLKGGHFEVLQDGSFARVISEVWLELEGLDKA